jgi:hypothetical protein
MDVWLDKLKNEAWPGRRRFPSGTESTVSVLPDDWFFGVDKSWLVERLRLDPESSPLDLGDRGGFVVYLDDDMIDIPDELASQDFDDLLGPGQTNGELVTYGDGGIIGGRFDVTGGWIHDSSPEIRNRYIWVGADANLSELALTCLSEGMEYWEPNEDDLFEVTSPYLDASNAADVDNVLALSCQAGVVTLNGSVVFEAE